MGGDDLMSRVVGGVGVATIHMSAKWLRFWLVARRVGVGRMQDLSDPMTSLVL
jgi:hypothetical protein